MYALDGLMFFIFVRFKNGVHCAFPPLNAASLKIWKEKKAKDGRIATIKHFFFQWREVKT